MSTTGTTVTVNTVADLVPDRWWPVQVPGVGYLLDGCPVQVTLTWDVTRPYEVLFRFRTGAGWVPWLVSRELLALGLLDPVEELIEPFEDHRAVGGAGDVQFEPLGDDALLMTLRSPSGFARFLFHPGLITGFLRETYQQVPLGHEYVDPAVWDRLLAGGR